MKMPHGMLSTIAAVMLTAAAIGGAASAAGPPMDTESLAPRLADAMLILDIEYAATPGPASTLLAANNRCGQCHMPQSDAHGVNARLQSRVTLNTWIVDNMIRQSGAGAGDGAGSGIAAIEEPPRSRTAGILLQDGRTVLATDSLRNAVVRVTASRIPGGKVELKPVARIPAAGLLAFRLKDAAAGGIEVAGDDAALGSQALVGMLPEDSRSPEITLTLVAATDQIVNNGLPLQKLDLRGVTCPPGSPVINAGGRLIGLVAVPDNPSDVMLLPAKSLRRIVSQLPENESENVLTLTLPVPWIGVRLEDDDGRVIATEILEETPAAAAGLEQGDVILSAQGRPVYSNAAFIAAVRTLDPGDDLTLTLDRDGETVALTLTPAQRPGSEPAVSAAGGGGCPIMNHWNAAANPNLWKNSTSPVDLGLLMTQENFEYGSPYLQAQPIDADGDGNLDLLLNYHMLRNGLAVVPSAPDNERLQELASQLDEVAESLRVLSEEVRALRDNR